MRLHLWFYDMLLDARKNLCKGVERGNLTTEEALKTYTDIILKTLEPAAFKKPEAIGEIKVNIKADTKEFDKAIERIIKQARRTFTNEKIPGFSMMSFGGDEATEKVFPAEGEETIIGKWEG